MQYPEFDVEAAAGRFKDSLGMAVALVMLVAALGATAYPFYLFAKFQIVKSYAPVPARVVDIRDRHERRRGNVTVYYAVEYDYTYDGKTFRGSNPTLEGGETVNADLVDRLADAKREGRTVTAWVNPRSPQTSLLDRNLDTTMIAVSSIASLVGVTFIYWVLYFMRTSKSLVVPGIFNAFPFKRHLDWLTWWAGYACAIAGLSCGCLAFVGSGATPWMLGLAALAGWFLSKALARRRFFADLGQVEIRWQTPLSRGQSVDLEIRLSRPRSLEHIELGLTCIGHPAPGSFEPRKQWFERRFSPGDFRPTDVPGVFATGLILPADAPPSTPAGGDERVPSVSWTFTLAAPALGNFVQSLSPTVG